MVICMHLLFTGLQKQFTDLCCFPDRRMATAWQAGMHLQNANGTAFLFSFYGYHGRSMHGMFYTGSDDYYALGFQLLL